MTTREFFLAALLVSWAAALSPAYAQNCGSQVMYSLTYNRFLSDNGFSGCSLTYQESGTVAPIEARYRCPWLFYNVDIERQHPGFIQWTGTNALRYEIDGTSAVHQYSCTCSSSSGAPSCAYTYNVAAYNILP